MKNWLKISSIENAMMMSYFLKISDMPFRKFAAYNNKQKSGWGDGLGEFCYDNWVRILRALWQAGLANRRAPVKDPVSKVTRRAIKEASSLHGQTNMCAPTTTNIHIYAYTQN